MIKKSKFVTFILSFIPGLSHYYLGVRDRALIFFAAFFGLIFGTMGLCAIVHDDNPAVIVLMGLPLIWLVALIDAFSLYDRLTSGETAAGSGIMSDGHLLLATSNRKVIAMVLSVVPGAGHMYLGLQRQGLQVMTAFFFAVFFMGWLNMSLFLFILPVIWFYSLFDAMHRADEDAKWVDDTTDFPLFGWFKLNHKLIGWGLILLGILVVFERIVAPFISWEIRNYLQTGIVALILIGSGIKLLLGRKQAEEDDQSCDSGE